VAQVATGGAIGLGFAGEVGDGMRGENLIGHSVGYGLGFNPNPIAVQIAVSAVLSYSLLLMARGNGRAWKTILATTFLLALAGLAATKSESALIGAVLAMAAVTVIAARSGLVRTRVVFRLGVAAGLLIALMSGSLFVLSSLSESEFFSESPLITELPSQVSVSFEERLNDYELGMPTIGSNYVVGGGFANYPLLLKESIEPSLRHEDSRYLPVHNVALLSLAELGVPGLIAWALIVGVPMLWTVRGLLGARASHQALLWTGPLLIILAESFVDFTPRATQDGRVLFVVVLALWAASVASRRRRAREAPSGVSVQQPYGFEPAGPAMPQGAVR
jgi:O-antigen ligase